MECRFINWVEPGLSNPSCGSGFDSVATGFEVLGNMAERGKIWTEAETAKLIEAWSEKTVQSYLLGSNRNAKAFEKIVQVLAAHNFQRIVKQCQDQVPENKL